MKINKQTGFSLIELLIAMMIGLFLVFIVISSYSTSKSSNTQRAELGELESNARIAMAFLREGIEHAGYPSIYVHTLEKPFLTESGSIKGYVCSDTGVVNYSSVDSINNSGGRHTKDNDQTDIISVAYMPDNPNDLNMQAYYWQDCAGSYAVDAASNSIEAASCSADPVNGQGDQAVIYNSYFIDNNELKCASSRNKVVPIASGIEAIQYQYGVRTAGNMKYQNATTVEADNAWSNVVSVQIAMLVRSAKEVKPVKEVERFLLLDRLINRDDQFIRKIFTSTVHLVNKDR